MLLQMMLLIHVAYGRIKIDVVASTDTKTSRVKISGENVDIITDVDIEAINITKDIVNKGLLRMNGVIPEDIFYHSPTPWHDLYITHHWEQVRRHLIPSKATILSLDSNTQVLLSDVFDDKNKDVDNFLTQIPRKIENTVTSLWDKKKNISAGKEIIYKFTMNLPDVLGSEEFVYLWKWGRNVEKREELVAGLQTPMNVNLSPNRTIVAELLMQKTVMKILVEYEATVTGQITLNYGINKFNGHHFYAWPAIDMLEYMDMPKKILSSEVVEIVQYCSGRVVFRDKDTQETVHSVSLDVI